MAGDWIKMRVDLGDDPAVVLIAACLDTTEDEVVGKLHRLWSWADRHTTDGTAPAITAKWVDRYVGRSGFAEAMAKAAWISFSEDGVAFPGFDRHNGESAKRRGEAALRQRLSRKNRDEGVTGVERSAIPRPFIRHVLERDAYTCVYCGEESSQAQEQSRKAILSVDHIKPIARGGSAAVENLACCCRKCNSEKNDRTPEEWDLLPAFLQAGVSYVGGQLVTDASQEKRDESVTRGRGEERRKESSSSSSLRSEEEDGGARPSPGEACKAMKAAGMASVSPSSPDLIALLDAGITLAELVDATKYAVEKQKPFSYALKTAEGRRRDAARIAPLPAAGAAPRNGSHKYAAAAAGIFGSPQQQHGEVIDV